MARPVGEHTAKEDKSFLSGQCVSLEQRGRNLKGEVNSRAVGARAGASRPSQPANFRDLSRGLRGLSFRAVL
jgi:hypothetical protein